MAAKRRSRRSASWTDEETECLLAIWGEKKIEMLLEDPKKHKGSIYSMIEKEMAKNSHEKSGQQCKIRMHTLRKNFRDCNKKLKTSGNARKVCKFYPKLAELLGDRPASLPLKVVESLTRKRLYKEDVSDDASEIDAIQEDPRRVDADGDAADRDSDAIQDPDAANADADADDTYKPLDDSEDDIAVAEPAVTQNADKMTNEKKESCVVKTSEKKKRKTKLETVIGSLMTNFNDSNSKLEGTLVDLETKKIDIELKRIELEKQKLESEERQRRKERAMKREERQEERRHQFQMMNMILGRVNAVPTGNMFTPATSFSDNHTPTTNSFKPNVSYDDGGCSFFEL